MDSVAFLKTNATDEEFVFYATPRQTFIHTVLVPAGNVTPPDVEDLMSWSFNPYGSWGGSVQPEMHAQHMINMIDLGMNAQMTTDAARFTHDQTRNALRLEANLFALVGEALKAKGHEVSSTDGSSVGGYQGSCSRATRRWPRRYSIAAASPLLPVNGVYRAGSDHRKDGQAVGW